jgi:branched-chain amino acid transport system ATP-binding protein
MLDLRAISKDFGGLRVLDKVSFSAEQGIIMGLIGPNGAGKTTLFNIVSGLLRPTTGSVFFRSEDITRFSPPKIAELGISRTFQNIRIFGDMTILENVLVGMHHLFTYSPGSALFGLSKKRTEETRMREKAREILRLVRLDGQAADKAGGLSYGEQRRLELARALATDPKILLLDEPTAGMNPAETEEIMGEIVKINKAGYTICIIEHDMKLIMGICRRIAVLNFGELIAVGGPEEIRANPLVVEAYLGKEAAKAV